MSMAGTSVGVQTWERRMRSRRASLLRLSSGERGPEAAGACAQPETTAAHRAAAAAARRGDSIKLSIDGERRAVRRHLARQAVDHVELGAHRPLRARRALAHGLEDALRGPDGVGLLRHLEAALRMDDDPDPGDLRAPAVHHLRREPVVDGAVALPEHDARAAELVVAQ